MRELQIQAPQHEKAAGFVPQMQQEQKWLLPDTMNYRQHRSSGAASISLKIEVDSRSKIQAALKLRLKMPRNPTRIPQSKTCKLLPYHRLFFIYMPSYNKGHQMPAVSNVPRTKATCTRTMLPAINAAFITSHITASTWQVCLKNLRKLSLQQFDSLFFFLNNTQCRLQQVEFRNKHFLQKKRFLADSMLLFVFKNTFSSYIHGRKLTRMHKATHLARFVL